MNSYNNKNHNNSINNNYNKTNSTKSGFDLIVISLVVTALANISQSVCEACALKFVSIEDKLPLVLWTIRM